MGTQAPAPRDEIRRPAARGRAQRQGDRVVERVLGSRRPRPWDAFPQVKWSPSGKQVMALIADGRLKNKGNVAGLWELHFLPASPGFIWSVPSAQLGPTLPHIHGLCTVPLQGRRRAYDGLFCSALVASCVRALHSLVNQLK